MTLLYIIYLRKNIGIRVPIAIFFREAALSAPSAAICFVAAQYFTNPFVALAAGGILAIVVWGALHPKTLKMVC